MSKKQLLRQEYVSKLHGGWLGMLAGATLGHSVAGKRYATEIEFYNPVPSQAVAKDFIDLQILALERRSDNPAAIQACDLAAAWRSRIRYGYDGYGPTRRNLTLGLHPPASGSYDNAFSRSIRAAARAPVWGFVSPGNPQAAARLAFEDATVDHTDEGVWAAMFWAAIISAAFGEPALKRLIDIGLAMIPPGCAVAKVVAAARVPMHPDMLPAGARAGVLAACSVWDWSDAPVNTGLAVLALCRATDFDTALTTAASSGFAADVNASLAGAVMGVLAGRATLPNRWTEPLGDTSVVGWGVDLPQAPKLVSELVAQAAKIGEQRMASPGGHMEQVDESAPEPDPQIELLAQISQPNEAIVSASIPSTGPAPNEVAEDAPTIVDVRAEMTAAEGEPAQKGGSTSMPAEALPDAARAANETQPPATVAPPLEAVAAVAGPVWTTNTLVLPLHWLRPNSAAAMAGKLRVVLDYGESGPAILPESARTLVFEVTNTGDDDFVGTLMLSAPSGWDVRVPGAQGANQVLQPGRTARLGFVVRVMPPAALEASNPLSLVVTPEGQPAASADFAILGGYCWWVLGALPNSLDEGFTKTYSVEDRPGMEERHQARSGGQTTWTRFPSTESALPLEASVFMGQRGVAYVRATVRSAGAVDARISLHSNDGVKAWLNGERVLQRHSHEAIRPTYGYGPCMADVKLQRGDNALVVKVVRDADPCDFAFMLTDRTGGPLLGATLANW